jgi:hypothetical protein
MQVEANQQLAEMSPHPVTLPPQKQKILSVKE